MERDASGRFKGRVDVDVEIEDVTAGEQAVERNKTNWYVPEHQVQVFIETDVGTADDVELITYFYELFLEADVKGRFEVVTYKVLSNGTKCYGFNGMCPLHKVKHDSYGKWQYKVAPGKYGGFKCWTDNDWQTKYLYDKLSLFNY